MKKLINALLDVSFLKFLVIGGTSTTIDFLLYTVMGRWISAVPAKLISMLFSTLFAFFLNRSWTFQRGEQPLLIGLGRYYLAQSANIATNVTANAMILRLTGRRIAAFLGATAIAMFVNYFLQKLYVFRKISE